MECSQRLIWVFPSLDDPLIWSILPFKYHFSPSNHRWSLGSYDIVFKNKSDALQAPFLATTSDRPPEPSPPSSSSAKSSPPTASTKIPTAVPSNLPCEKPSVSFPALRSVQQTHLRLSTPPYYLPTSQIRSPPQATSIPTLPMAQTHSPHPQLLPHANTPGYIYSLKVAYIKIHEKRCGTFTGAWRD